MASSVSGAMLMFGLTMGLMFVPATVSKEQQQEYNLWSEQQRLDFIQEQEQHDPYNQNNDQSKQPKQLLRRSLKGESLQGQEKYTTCITALEQADENQDGRISFEDFARFLALTAPTKISHPDDDNSVDYLSLDLRSVFYSDACLTCLQLQKSNNNNQDKECCTGDPDQSYLDLNVPDPFYTSTLIFVCTSVQTLLNDMTDFPTASPEEGPPTTESPTATPTLAPTTTPTTAPTSAPTASPTNGPTSSPSNGPTLGPTASPTDAPTTTPTAHPTVAPTQSPNQSDNEENDQDDDDDDDDEENNNPNSLQAEDPQENNNGGNDNENDGDQRKDKITQEHVALSLFLFGFATLAMVTIACIVMSVRLKNSHMQPEYRAKKRGQRQRNNDDDPESDSSDSGNGDNDDDDDSYTNFDGITKDENTDKMTKSNGNKKNKRGGQWRRQLWAWMAQRRNRGKGNDAPNLIVVPTHSLEDEDDAKNEEEFEISHTAAPTRTVHATDETAAAVASSSQNTRNSNNMVDISSDLFAARQQRRSPNSKRVTRSFSASPPSKQEQQQQQGRQHSHRHPNSNHRTTSRKGSSWIREPHLQPMTNNRRSNDDNPNDPSEDPTHQYGFTFLDDPNTQVNTSRLSTIPSGSEDSLSARSGGANSDTSCATPSKSHLNSLGTFLSVPWGTTRSFSSSASENNELENTLDSLNEEEIYFDREGGSATKPINTSSNSLRRSDTSSSWQEQVAGYWNALAGNRGGEQQQEGEEEAKEEISEPRFTTSMQHLGDVVDVNDAVADLRSFQGSEVQLHDYLQSSLPQRNNQTADATTSNKSKQASLDVPILERKLRQLEVDHKSLRDSERTASSASVPNGEALSHISPTSVASSLTSFTRAWEGDLGISPVQQPPPPLSARSDNEFSLFEEQEHVIHFEEDSFEDVQEAALSKGEQESLSAYHDPVNREDSSRSSTLTPTIVEEENENDVSDMTEEEMRYFC